MSVFNAQHITATRKPVSNVCKDREVPITNGVADGSRIGTPSFLSGITAGVADNINDGIDQTIINGDQVEEIRGKRAAKITNDCDTHILGSLKILVDGKEERAVLSGRSTFIGRTGIPLGGAQIGMDSTRVQGDRFVTIVGNDTRIVTGSSFVSIMAGEMNNEVSQKSDFIGWFRWQYGGDDIKATIWNIGIQGGKADFQLWKTDLSAIKTELKFVKGDGVGIQTELLGGAAKLGVIKVISGGVCNKLDLFGT
jgi:hypothetical protein